MWLIVLLLLSIVFIVFATAKLNMHPFLALLITAFGFGILGGMPLLVAAGIKTAQGSSTVSIITTAGLMAPLLPSLGLEGDTAKALAVIAIGAGAMVVSHANDSYFWVVTRFSNMDVATGYRLQTLGTLIEGTAAAITLWVLSLILL